MHPVAETVEKGVIERRLDARSLTVPVLFSLQWDDELTTRASRLRLGDAIGSAETATHVNPGGHVALVLVQRDAPEALYPRPLGPVAT